jgi:cytochrome c oxidase accessory protein FixG
VLLDRRSLVVGYDPVRGEPRAKGVKLRASSAGDCIDCRMCVTTCPTGIDIREGLQMECIHCTQCIDACDAVMAKIGRPPGLIRYSSTDALAGRGSPRLRPRIVVYPALLAIALGAMVWQLAIRPDADITLLRGIGAPYTLEPRGQVVNTIRIKILNRTRDPRRYLIALETPGARLIAPMNPLAVAGGATVAATVFVEAAPATFAGGSRPVRFRVSDGSGFDRALPYTLLGPESPGANR